MAWQVGPTERLRQLGLVLPDVPPPVGRFSHATVEGDLVFLSGQGPLLENGTLARGKVGADISADSARQHAMRTGLVLLSALRLAIGDLDRVSRVLKLVGFVNAAPDFERHPFVIDGCSELFWEVFGSPGQHARSAIGVSSLPGGITVEIEAVFSISATLSRKVRSGLRPRGSGAIFVAGRPTDPARSSAGFAGGGAAFPSIGQSADDPHLRSCGP